MLGLLLRRSPAGSCRGAAGSPRGRPSPRRWAAPRSSMPTASTTRCSIRSGWPSRSSSRCRRWRAWASPGPSSGSRRAAARVRTAGHLLGGLVSLLLVAPAIVGAALLVLGRRCRRCAASPTPVPARLLAARRRRGADGRRRARPGRREPRYPRPLMGYTLLDGDDPSIEVFMGTFRKVRAALGVTAFGINEIRLPAGAQGRGHDEEELRRGGGLRRPRRQRHRSPSTTRRSPFGPGHVPQGRPELDPSRRGRAGRPDVPRNRRAGRQPRGRPTL